MHTSLNPDGVGSGAGLMIRAWPHQDMMTLPLEEVQVLFKRAGALMFRGFHADPWRMKAFAGRFSARFNRDRLRPPVANSDGFIQKVDEGMGYAQPHCEQANSPFRPDAIWFCCTRPAAEGGETLFWDGVGLWERMTPELKAVFEGKRLRFFQKYPPERWKLFLGEGAGLADVRRALDGVEGVSYFIGEGEAVYLEYVCPAVVETRYGARKAFANNLLSERKNTLGKLMTFSDGTAISDAAIEALEAQMNELTERIAWQAGDLMMLDNTRFLHGRNAFTDPKREVYSCLSFLNF
jgi:alpha-ketoglutarate-dependent taurine dioxygenase